MTRLSEIRVIVAQVINIDEGKIGDHSDLVVLGLDSLKMVELLVAVEQKYKFRLPDQHLVPESFATLDSVNKMVEQFAEQQ